MPYIYWDSTYILVVIGAVICMIASARVKTTFNKYSAYRSMSGMTGAQAAERILHAAGIYDVRVQHVSGNLTDHYNPANKTLNLSDSVCNQTSVAAVGVAAHECGHAIQHARGYVPLRLRTAFVPIANFGSMLAWPVIILGVIINSRSSMMLINIGILLFSFAVLFASCDGSAEGTGNPGRSGTPLHKKSSYSSSTHVCGKCSSCDSAAASNRFTVWRKKS